MINNSHRLLVIPYVFIYEFFLRWLSYSDLYYILVNEATPVKSTATSLSYSIMNKYVVNVITSGVCWDIEAFEVLGTIGIRLLW